MDLHTLSLISSISIGMTIAVVSLFIPVVFYYGFSGSDNDNNSKGEMFILFLLLFFIVAGFGTYLVAEGKIKDKLLSELKKSKVVEKLYLQNKQKIEDSCVEKLKDCLKKRPQIEAGNCFYNAKKYCSNLIEDFGDNSQKTCYAFLTNYEKYKDFSSEVSTVCSIEVDKYKEELYNECGKKLNDILLNSLKEEQK